MAFNSRRFFRTANHGDWQRVSDVLEEAFSFGYFGSFYHSMSQTVATVDTATDVAFDSSWTSYDVSVASGHQITFAHAGDYVLTLVAHLSNLSSAVEEVRFWLRYNGTAYPYSASISTIAARKSAGVPFTKTETISFAGTATAAGDYVELIWSSSSTEVSLTAVPASGAVPASPSAVVSVSQIGAVR